MERLHDGLDQAKTLGVLLIQILTQKALLRLFGLPTFRYTNENLEAIVRGLDIQDCDRVLAICGSGDQAFAILESTRQILAIDVDDTQIRYAQKRANLLKLGMFDEFLNTGPRFITTTGSSAIDLQRIATRNRYFRSPERLARISGKIDNIKFIRADIADMNPKTTAEGFSKIYLSNVVRVDDSQRVLKRHSEFLERASNFLPAGGLIYLSNYNQIQKDACWLPCLISHPPSLQICERLTRLAQQKENEVESHWTPVVYRKVMSETEM